jgi:iron complex outermembrane receptor protein
VERPLISIESLSAGQEVRAMGWHTDRGSTRTPVLAGLLAAALATSLALPVAGLGQEPPGTGEPQRPREETREEAGEQTGEQTGEASAGSFEEAITVVGIRARADDPVTAGNLDREQIEWLSYGQDAPQLLQYTPSATWYSDSGTGSNYSYLSLRGVQQSRINMTFDGAPLNDPAEHALFFNNFSDFTNTVDSIQIQRGVGTSSVGSPSFGGSINFASRPPSSEAGGDFRLALGSYDTLRASLGYETGVLDSGVWVSGRYSVADTDGYRDNSGSEHDTAFVNAGWQGARSALRFVGFSGDVETQLAFLAVEPEILRQNRRHNPLDEAERDDFGQDFAQLKYSRSIGESSLLSASLYYNGAQGWFRIWDDPVARSALLQFGIDQAFVGSMITFATDPSGAAPPGSAPGRGGLAATFGLHYNDFEGDHTLHVEGERLYLNTGHKQTANAFAKLEYRLPDWVLFGDLQLRWADFRYRGRLDLGAVDWTFVDPRLGARCLLSPRTSLYGSLGRAQREPGRLDLLLGEDEATVPHDLEAVRPEEVVDFELGVDHRTADLALSVNLYAMEFSDEIALTGELSEVGLPLRRNVDDSHRRGLEVDLEWRPGADWRLFHSANLSRSRIESWTQHYDVYAPTGELVGSEPITYTDVPALLSPEVVVNVGAEWAPGDHGVALIARYVSESHLDNTGLDRFRLPSLTDLALRASLSLASWWDAGRPRLTLHVNNLLDSLDQYPSGYSYQYLLDDGRGGRSLDGQRYFYPLAERNAVLTLEIEL